MTRSPARTAGPIAAGLITTAVLFWPLVALVAMSVSQGESPQGGFTISARQLGLLGRSVWLSLAATIACLLFALPSAYALARIGNEQRMPARPLLLALLAVSLLCTPMVYAFGWQRLLPAGANPYLQCIAVWALWAWPIPALILATTWRRSGQAIYETALLDCSPARAFRSVGLPHLRGAIILSALILFILFMGEYTVPHAFGLLVYATELLGLSTSSSRTIDTLWPAIPVLAIIALTLLLAAWQWQRVDRSTATATHGGTESAPVWPAALVLGCFAFSWLLPVGGLTVGLSSPRAVTEAVQVYGRDMLCSLATAAAAGLLTMAIGLVLMPHPRLRRLSLIAAIAFGALPGAIVGEAMVAAYNRDAFTLLYDHWPVMVLACTCRFAWVGLLIALSLQRQGRHLIDQARTDGAGPLRLLLHVTIPMWLPTLLFGAAAVAALSLADIAATTMVRVPDFNPIAHVIIEKFHRREDDMLISLSLTLILAALPAALLAAAAFSRARIGRRA